MLAQPATPAACSLFPRCKKAASFAHHVSDFHLVHDAGCEGSCAGPTKEAANRNLQAHRAMATSALLMATGPGAQQEHSRMNESGQIGKDKQKHD